MMVGRDRRARDRPIPAHPYRDTVVVYGVMAVVLVVVATLTGGSPLKAVLAAGVFFVLATGWSWWRFRQRIRAREAAARSKAEAAAARTAPGPSANGNGRGSVR